MSSKSEIESRILDEQARTHADEPRVELRNGTTIRDVYAAFCDGLGNVIRTEAELRDVIHEAGLRYDDCSRLSVSLAWAQCQADDSEWHVDTIS